MNILSEKELAKDVKDKLGQQVDPGTWSRIWQYLKDKGYLEYNDENHEYEWSIDDLAKEVRVLIDLIEETTSDRRKIKRGKGKKADEIWEEQPLTGADRILEIRQEVLAEFFADMAGEDQEVIAFREDVLDGQLLAWEGVHSWIEKQHRREKHLPGPWLTVSLPLNDEDIGKPITDTADYLRVMRRKLKKTSPDYQAKVHWPKVAYAIPDSDQTMRTAVRIDGTLDQLRKVSESLAKYYGWQDRQATVFILTGTVPEVSLVRASVTVAPGARRINGVLCPQPVSTYRIKLEIDPTLTAKQVLGAYRIVRKRFPREGRYRPQSEKHLRLAQFLIRQPEDRSAKDRLDLWRMTHANDEWYRDRCGTGNFNRDSKTVVERLLNPGFGPPEI